MISFSHVSKTYKSGLLKSKVTAVEDLDFSIRQGEVFGMVGPNGAGKSTTIKLLLGLLKPDRGEILFHDRPLGSSEFRRNIGYLPENPYLYDHLNLLELLRFGGKSSGMDSASIGEKGEELIGRMGLTHVQRRPVRTFSKGMLQKTAICFALLHDPQIVILDEPMSGLDPLGRKLVFDLVMELKEKGRTIFFCSHILSDVERLCDRIGFMNRGRLARVFDPEQEMGDQILITLSEISPSLKPVLEEYGATCKFEGPEKIVATNSRSFERIAALIHSENATIRDVRRKEFSLEDLFLEVVEAHHVE